MLLVNACPPALSRGILYFLITGSAGSVMNLGPAQLQAGCGEKEHGLLSVSVELLSVVRQRGRVVRAGKGAAGCKASVTAAGKWGRRRPRAARVNRLLGYSVNRSAAGGSLPVVRPGRVGS